MEKPWKSYDEQLEILKSRGMLVSNEAAAIDYLDRIGYYRLSGYWYSFRMFEQYQLEDGRTAIRRANTFFQGACFEDAVKLYIFDKKLRLLALDALERIELAIRVDMAHMLGEKDIYAYTNPNLFHGHFSRKKQRNGKTQHDIWLEKHEALIYRARREPFVKHYLEKYERLPIWVAIEVWDFGLLSKLFSGLKIKDKDTLAKKYGVKDGDLFQKWLRSLNFIRNVSAHHSRLWNINVLERSPVINDDVFWQSLADERPFYYFCIMQKLLQQICPNSKWHERFKALMGEFPNLDYCNMTLKSFGIIDSWQEWELWRQK